MSKTIKKTNDDLKWEKLFSRPESEVLLKRMSDKAWAEYEAGRTRPLDDLFSDSKSSRPGGKKETV